jgi:hypothetical protein
MIYFVSIDAFTIALSFHITGYGCTECIENEQNNGLKYDIQQVINEVRRIDKS